MKWLYLIAAVAAGGFILWKWFPLIQRFCVRRSYQKDPDGYCKWLYKEVVNGTPKDKIRALRFLFELSANGARPAIAQLWQLLDTPGLQFELKDPIAGFLRQCDQPEWRRREIERKKQIINRPKEQLAKGLKMLEENDFIKHQGKRTEWRRVDREIRAIAESYPFPPERQLRLMYLCVHDSFSLSNHGAFGPDSTFGGGTYEEIAKKREAYRRQLGEVEKRIENDYQKALDFSETVDEKAIEFYKERVKKYPFTVFF